MGFANTAGEVASSSLDYWEAFALAFDPFDPSSDSSSDTIEFYSGGQREQVLDQVAHLSQFSASVVVVAGERGSGRTTLKNQLQLLLEERFKLADITADAMTEPERIFGDIAFALGCEVSGNASAGEIISAIRHELLHQQDEPLLVLLDDAHRLGDAVLSALVSLLQSSRQDDELPFQVVMFGDLNLIGRLDGFGMVDILLHDVVLPPLSEEAMADYLLFKLEAAGWEGDLPFDEDELNSLYGGSGGIPGAVHRPARELLIEKRPSQVASPAERSLGLPVGHMFSLVVLFGVLLMAFFYKDSWLGGDEQQSDDQVVSSGEAVESRQVVERTATSVKIPLGAGSDGGAGVQGGEPAVAGSDFRSETASVELPLTPTDPVPGSSGSESKETENSGVETSKPEKLSSSSAPAPVASGSSEAVQDAAVPGVAEDSAAILGAAEPQGGAEVQLSSDERYLMSLAATRYVLQVMAASSEPAVKAYIKRQKNEQALRLFTSSRSGKPWYVVVAGDYPTVDAARQGVASLPDEQRKAGPWPRRVGDVQSNIKEYRGI
ncbi:AAA family ATPase [Pseudomaricurvus sp.]|uniref:AAA family ATPase n=1 Tax=Pseudomaricurvus sp. TaxID=2004510 RepID=UPI003F6B7B1F